MTGQKPKDLCKAVLCKVVGVKMIPGPAVQNKSPIVYDYGDFHRQLFGDGKGGVP